MRCGRAAREGVCAARWGRREHGRVYIGGDRGGQRVGEGWLAPINDGARARPGHPAASQARLRSLEGRRGPEAAVASARAASGYLIGPPNNLPKNHHNTYSRNLVNEHAEYDDVALRLSDARSVRDRRSISLMVLLCQSSTRARCHLARHPVRSIPSKTAFSEGDVSDGALDWRGTPLRAVWRGRLHVPVRCAHLCSTRILQRRVVLVLVQW